MPLHNRHKSKIAIILAAVIFANILLIGIASGKSSAQSQPVFGAPIDLSNDQNTATTPNVQSVGSNVYVVWAEQNRGVLFRTSPDGGETWNPPVTEPALKISPPGGIPEDPLMSANGSNVYVTWSETVNTTARGNPALEVFEATSTNQGTSFNPPVQLTTGNGVSGGRNAIPGYLTPIPVSWGNNVYVTYASGNNSYVTCSSDAGAPGTWTPAFHYGDAREDQDAVWGGKYVYVTSDDSLYVSSNNCETWTNHTPQPGLGSESWIEAYGPNVYDAGEGKGNTSVVHYVYSNDYGAKWSKTQVLTKTLADAWAPMVWAYGNSAWIAVHTYPGGLASQVYMYMTSNGGKTWTGPVTLSAAPKVLSDTSFPFTVSSSDGKNIFVAWAQQSPPGYWTLLASYSSNGGASWTAPPGIDVSQNRAGINSSSNNDLAVAAIASSGPYCFAVYEQSNKTSSQIYFASNNSGQITTSTDTTSTSYGTTVTTLTSSVSFSRTTGSSITTRTSSQTSTSTRESVSSSSIQFPVPSTTTSRSGGSGSLQLLSDAGLAAAVIAVASLAAVIFRSRRKN